MFVFTRVSRLVFLVLLALHAVGCADDTSVLVGEEERIVAVETLSIGSLLEGPEAFGRIGGVIEDRAGRIYVADMQEGEIRAFSPGGEHLYSFGRRGAGPGELGSPCCLAWGPDAALWVRDGDNQRYSVFEVGDTSARFLTSRRMAHSDVSYMAPVTFTSSGALIDVGHRREANGESKLVRFTLDETDSHGEAGMLARASAEDLGGQSVSARGGAVIYFLYQPFGARELVTHGPGDRWANGISSAYEITLRQGDSVRTIVGSGSNPPLSTEERAAALRQMEADAARAGITVQRLPYGVPETKMPVQAIFFDQVGRLWVEHSRVDGDPRAADVWGTDGSLEQRVQWPADISLALPGWIGEHSALGLRRDSLGVEYVVRLTFGE